MTNKKNIITIKINEMKKLTIGLILSLISMFCHSQTTYKAFAGSAATYNSYSGKWEWGERQEYVDFNITIDGKHVYLSNKSKTHLYLIGNGDKIVNNGRTTVEWSAIDKGDEVTCKFKITVWDDKTLSRQFYIEYDKYILCYSLYND